MKEKIDDSFLRCIKRISKKLQGFKSEESAKKAKDAEMKVTEEEEADEDVIEAMPLATIPPSSSGVGVAPYLNSEILKGIAEGFLQKQLESVSAALLKKDNLNG